MALKQPSLPPAQTRHAMSAADRRLPIAPVSALAFAAAAPPSAMLQRMAPVPAAASARGHFERFAATGIDLDSAALPFSAAPKDWVEGFESEKAAMTTWIASSTTTRLKIIADDAAAERAALQAANRKQKFRFRADCPKKWVDTHPGGKELAKKQWKTVSFRKQCRIKESFDDPAEHPPQRGRSKELEFEQKLNNEWNAATALLPERDLEYQRAARGQAITILSKCSTLETDIENPETPNPGPRKFSASCMAVYVETIDESLFQATPAANSDALPESDKPELEKPRKRRNTRLHIYAGNQAAFTLHDLRDALDQYLSANPGRSTKYACMPWS